MAHWCRTRDTSRASVGGSGNVYGPEGDRIPCEPERTPNHPEDEGGRRDSRELSDGVLAIGVNERQPKTGSHTRATTVPYIVGYSFPYSNQHFSYEPPESLNRKIRLKDKVEVGAQREAGKPSVSCCFFVTFTQVWSADTRSSSAEGNLRIKLCGATYMGRNVRQFARDWKLVHICVLDVPRKARSPHVA